MFTIRNYDDGDLPALLDFAARRLDGGGDAVAAAWRGIFGDTLRTPGREPQHDCILLLAESALLGFCLIFREPSIGRCVLNIDTDAPAGDGDGYRSLAAAGVQRAAAVDAAVVHVAIGPSYERAPALEAEGFAMARTYWGMTLTKQTLPDVALPDRYRIRPFRAHDIPALTAVHNAAFADSWCFAPDTEARIAHRSRMGNTSCDGIRLLFDGENMAGYCWTLLVSDGQRRHGAIGSMGLGPAYHGRGLGKAILLSGIDYLLSAGADYIRLEVDAANTPAIRLYRSTGFVKTGELRWYERRL